MITQGIEKIIAVLICISIFGIHASTALSAIGVAGLLAASAGAVAFFLINLMQNPKINSDINKIITPLFLLATLYIVNGFLTLSFINSFSRFVQIASVASLVYIFFCAAQRNKGNNLLLYFTKIFGLSAVTLSFIVLIGFQDENSAGFLNKNVLGGWLAVAGIIGLAGIQRKYFINTYIILLTAALFFSGSRTSVMAFFIGLLVYYAWSYLKSNKFIFWSFFFGLAAFSFFSIWIISGFDIGVDLVSANMAVRNITSKNLLSGRDVIWPGLLELIWQKPWMGWGGGDQISKITDSSLSAHNLFLQILVQVGFVGFSIFVYVLLAIWQIFWKFRIHPYVKFSCSAFVVVLVSQNFEVTMLQNNLALSYPMWAFIGLCLGRARLASRT